MAGAANKSGALEAPFLYVRPDYLTGMIKSEEFDKSALDRGKRMLAKGVMQHCGGAARSRGVCTTGLMVGFVAYIL
ncbi:MULTISPECIES: hypothetical protein [Paraburkholderia]|nr:MULTISPECIES: hypothetical protein [Paraburkholderia]ALP63274.1 hypothetical protein AN416_12230 [Paraburkholderia caribensis]AMV42328.1 hypothetical protein ATN79_06495 [Paraburkholderia caribensis]AUT51485.1 hypothetical protein C2L66_06125 [Paraburkholderia caribensis]MDR6383546.1 hypothetical protein [Paraburkholderia caribensis]CAG9198367.1 conserved hypothetical protein [Paraburkholderia caribensis]